jgi:hypothetical protein
VEVDQRYPALHGKPKTDVLVVPRVNASISIPKKTVFTECVIVRARLTLRHRHGRDAERDVAEDAGFEDTLGPHERDALTFIHEPFGKHLARQDALISGEPLLLLEERERGESNLGIVEHGGRPILTMHARLETLFHRVTGGVLLVAILAAARLPRNPRAPKTVVHGTSIDCDEIRTV